MTIPWFLAAQAELVTGDPSEGSIYPSQAEGNRRQAEQSAYYDQNYDIGDDFDRVVPQYSAEELQEQAIIGQIVGSILHYMFVKMEPTDRCLRPPGDYYDPKRMEEGEA